ncbi:hypothetical protein K788_0004393 (plasmid) [Paraburkholderia caribensis MBA4]|uniref:Uncharacterized protein n=1 Tax=Paraburkholderia caribensis MBA4 TaxID=1323664 RepID=A0A0P0RNY6_9BURK|nr:hypothetical protein K788_0004393 [Paraburkholderia caribensis MBA4]
MVRFGVFAFSLASAICPRGAGGSVFLLFRWHPRYAFAGGRFSVFAFALASAIR